MTKEQRSTRIRELAHELSTLLNDGKPPRPQPVFLTQDDFPPWIVEGFRHALQRALTKKTPALN